MIKMFCPCLRVFSMEELNVVPTIISEVTPKAAGFGATF